MRTATLLAAALLAAAVVGAAGCRPDAAVGQPAALPSFPDAKIVNGMELSAAVVGRVSPQLVGVPVRVRARFRNVSDHPLSFGQESGAFPAQAKLRYSEAFGDKKLDYSYWDKKLDYSYRESGDRHSTAVRREQVVTLAPGQTWEVETAVIPKVPGSATLSLRVSHSSDRCWDYIKGKPYPDGDVPMSYGTVPLESPWKGYASFSFAMRIEPCPDHKVTPAWKERRRTLGNAEASLYDKKRALVFSDSERTSSSVGFLIGQVKALPSDSPLRPFAVWQLAEMACAGYGFEAIELLLAIAGDKNEPEAVRAPVAGLVTLLRGERSIRFSVDGNEGEYLVSDALRKRAEDIWEAGQNRAESDGARAITSRLKTGMTYRQVRDALGEPHPTGNSRFSAVYPVRNANGEPEETVVIQFDDSGAEGDVYRFTVSTWSVVRGKKDVGAQGQGERPAE
jgi:hypothetical protein